MTTLATLPVISDLLSKSRGDLLKAIPKQSNLSPDRLIRIAQTEFGKNPKFKECDPISFCRAVMDAAQMGLEFGEMKQCALIPYGKEIKLMVQYQGWMALLWRAKTITDIQTRVVYEGDFFKVSYGSKTELVHEPAFESNVPLKYYALATPTGGQPMFEVMTLADIQDHAKQYAKGLDKKDSPWNTAFDAMALKTVLRKLMKLLPMSSDSEVVHALKADDQIWEAEVKEARVEKFKQVSAAPNVPTETEREVAMKDYVQTTMDAETRGLNLADLPKVTEKTDPKRIVAITDTIRFRIEGLTTAPEASTYA